MLQIEFAKIFEEEVAARWSKCNFSKLDIDDWFVAFGSEKPDAFVAAVQAHRIKEDPSRPKITSVRAILRKSMDNFGGYKEPVTTGREITCKDYYSWLVENGSVEDRKNAWSVSAAYRELDPEIGQLIRGEIDESQVKQPEQEAQICVDELPW